MTDVQLSGPSHGPASGNPPKQLVVLLHEFKAGLTAYLESSQAPLRTLDALIDFNESHAGTVMPLFGQDLFRELDGILRLERGQVLHRLDGAVNPIARRASDLDVEIGRVELDHSVQQVLDLDCHEALPLRIFVAP